MRSIVIGAVDNILELIFYGGYIVAEPLLLLKLVIFIVRPFVILTFYLSCRYAIAYLCSFPGNNGPLTERGVPG